MFKDTCLLLDTFWWSVQRGRTLSRIPCSQGSRPDPSPPLPLRGGPAPGRTDPVRAQTETPVAGGAGPIPDGTCCPHSRPPAEESETGDTGSEQDTEDVGCTPDTHRDGRDAPWDGFLDGLGVTRDGPPGRTGPSTPRRKEPTSEERNPRAHMHPPAPRGPCATSEGI